MLERFIMASASESLYYLLVCHPDFRLAYVLTLSASPGLMECHVRQTKIAKIQRFELSLHVIQDIENEEDEKLLHHCAY